MKFHWLCAASVLSPIAAHAQADANPVKSAGDAFGHKQGDEAIGIYDEKSVRGFSLEAAGNYRVNGTYFVKTGGVSSFFVDSSTVRIGYNTLTTILPGPSGIVDYRLRRPAPGEPSQATLNIDSYGQASAELNLRHGSETERTSYSVGVSRNFNASNAQGGRGGEELLVAGILRTASERTALQIFGGEYQYRRRGEFRVRPSASSLPSRIERGRYLGQEWAYDEGQRRTAGVLIDTEFDDKAGIGATAVFGQDDPTIVNAQFFTMGDQSNSVDASLLIIPKQRSQSFSGEGRAYYQFATGNLHHRFDLSLRFRRSEARLGGADILDLGTVELGTAPAEIENPTGRVGDPNQNIRVAQEGIGLAYRGALGEAIRWNAGLLRTFYRKRFKENDNQVSDISSQPLLYNIGASFWAHPELEFYGSYSRGLEEAGTAPSSASNRNEILDTIIVRQAEIGTRWAPADAISVLVAAFDTRKPYAGLDPATNVYRFLGKTRHRGAELSISAKPLAGARVILGGVVLDPTLGRSLDDASSAGLKPVAVPRLRAVANLDMAVPGIDGLSLDAGLTHVSSRAVRSSLNDEGRQLRTRALSTLNLGFRYAVELPKSKLVLRAQVLNATNTFAWDVNTSETLAYTEPRRARLLATLLF